MLRYIVAATAALLLAAAPAQAAPAVGQSAPDFSAADYTGAPVKLSDFKGKIVVLEWTNPFCPFVVKHYDSGNMLKLQDFAKEQGVVWITVNSSAPGKQGHVTPSDIKAKNNIKPLKSAHYVIDEKGELGKLYDAKTTPHMFVIDKNGAVAYMGAIDSKPSAEKTDIATSTNYVKAALDSLLAGKPVETASTQAYGCSVKYAD